MKCVLVFVALLVAQLRGLQAAEAPRPSRSPANQVFQFMVTVTHTPTAAPGLAPTTADAYLWIPPACRRLRGVVVLAQNVPEHWLAGHPAMRAACTDCDLALLFTCRSFLMFNTFKDYPDRDAEHGRFLQRILDELADKSGYAELATVPWFPMGESMALMVPNALTSAFPNRCIAGVQIKDGQWDRLKSPQVPVLVTTGTAAEWEQHRFDIFTRWREQATENLRQHRAKRAAQPEWPGSLLIEGGSAHFACTEPMAVLIAQYMRAACQARLAPDGSPALRPVNLAAGFVTGLPVPGVTPLPPVSYAQCTPEQRSLPWYFDEASARAACDLARINWDARPQVPAFADAAGQPLPFNTRGIFGPLRYATLDDGITFRLAGTFLDRLPNHFVKGGAALDHAPGQPAIEWLCGPYVPLGSNTFQVALDRTWRKTDSYVRVWHPGDETHRLATNPGGLKFEPNTNGRPQIITFAPIPDQAADAREAPLQATSDAGLPVRFFVRAGPATVQGDRLVFTPIPSRSKLPLTVTVVAWQWGRTAEPRVQTAALVERTFLLGAKPEEKRQAGGGVGATEPFAAEAWEGNP